jgi:hypothetical protein
LLEDQHAAADVRLPGALRIGVALIVLSVGRGIWLTISGTESYLVATHWGQTFLFAALMAALIAKVRREAASPNAEQDRAPSRTGIPTRALVSTLYWAALLSYGVAFRHHWAEVTPWSTGAVVLVALYTTFLLVPWLLWREIR